MASDTENGFFGGLIRQVQSAINTSAAIGINDVLNNQSGNANVQTVYDPDTGVFDFRFAEAVTPQVAAENQAQRRFTAGYENQYLPFAIVGGAAIAAILVLR